MNYSLLISWQKGKALYLLLWMGAAIVTLIIIMSSSNDEIAVKHLFKDQSLVSPEVTDQTINELLISVDELNISEKKSFINLYLKPTESDLSITPAQSNGEGENVYKQILHSRIEKLKHKRQDEDFSVKPVPIK